MINALDKYPRWVRSIAAWSKPGEIGVGDTFHRIAESIGAEHLSRLIKWFGIDCGCANRREKWNELYRYDDNGWLI